MRPHPSADSRGFVLISVVIFVLIITLIGLSIFTMDSFEARFLGDDLDQSRSYLAAKGGLVRGRAVLESTGLLDKVQQDLPPRVVSAIARQDGRSTGGVVFYDNPDSAHQHPVELEVKAQFGSRPRTLSALFDPVSVGAAQSLALIANRDTMRVGPEVGITGPVRQASNDVSWVSQVTGFTPSQDLTIGEVQAPDIDGFIQRKRTGAKQVKKEDGAWEFSGGVYLSPDTGEPWAFYDPNPSPITVEVKGYNVWLVERGVKFHGRVSFRDAGDSQRPGRLVIVSKRGGTSPSNFGARFYHGIDRSSNVPMAIVTNGRVVIGEAATERHDLSRISILSEGVDLTRVGLTYNAAEMDTLLRNLQANDFYPGAQPGVSGVLRPVQSGWTDKNAPLNN